MPEQIEVTAKCSVCGKTFTAKNIAKAVDLAEQCEGHHSAVYVELTLGQIQGLLRLMVAARWTDLEGLVDPDCYKQLRRFVRGA